MERSLDSIVEEIAQNDEMSKEFAAMDEMDEIYQYCKDAGLDCSEEEFDDEISALIDDFEYSGAKISEYELKGVAGGKNRDYGHRGGSTLGQLILQNSFDSTEL